MIEWLPADSEHPPRPDVPILSHLTFVEIHAMELGLGLGLFAVWAVELNEAGIALLLGALAARRIISAKRKKGTGTKCDHTIGMHDAIADPHYFVVTAVAVVLAYNVATMLFL